MPGCSCRVSVFSYRMPPSQAVAANGAERVASRSPRGGGRYRFLVRV
jgi:hypothetical protein